MVGQGRSVACQGYPFPAALLDLRAPTVPGAVRRSKEGGYLRHNWHSGNAAEDGQSTRGWLLGAFIDPAWGVRSNLTEGGAMLARLGDYLVWGPGTGHSWEALARSVVITVRWPSGSG